MQSTQTKLLRSLSMGHLGSTADCMSTRERVMPSLDELSGSKKTMILRERRETKKGNATDLIKGAVNQELQGIRKLVEENKLKSENTVSMLSSLSDIVKDLRHRAREALSQTEVEFADGPRTRKPFPKYKTLARAKKLMERLPEDLQEDVKKVVGLHNSASLNKIDFQATRHYTPALNNDRRTLLARHGQNMLASQLEAPEEEKRQVTNNQYIELPRLSFSRMNIAQQSGSDTQRRAFSYTPSVFGRLLDESKFTGQYKERFNDFSRDYFDTHRMVDRPTFTRMHNNRVLHKEKQRTSRGKFKSSLRGGAAEQRFPNCTF